MPEVKPAIETLAKIKVVGVGGSGGAAINRMMQSKIKGVEFIAINTDLQALHCLQAPVKIHIGKTITRGLGAGMNPDIGFKAAEESQEEIREALKGADMVFITCGLGGGTGSGAGPLVADIAKSSGALTIAVVTKPFSFEGRQRREIGENAHQQFLEKVDTIITIPNDRVMQIIDKKTPLIEAFRIIDDVLRQGVQGISEIITVPGLINVDFADVRAIMQDTGSALMGIGYGSGESRVVDAAKSAIASPLLDLSIDGAKGILFIVTAGSDVGMHEIAEAAKIVTGNADENAKVIWGTVIDESLKDEVKITVIATGFEKKSDSTFMNRMGKSAFSSSFNTLTVPENPKTPEKKPISSLRPEPEKNNVEFNRTDFSSTPLQKKSVKRLDLEKEENVPVINKKNEEDELEIPAFIRRKMT
ncbi:MAG: Cell division protein FtsZ [Candidatus Magasanikbacteria bacterium GW2011_GWC2_40_17]|uniref:Cell division protein FtsZ n=1 Tax=Candidatus Magasanikbacteria bacterium GW2011_GWA2_42_32 TaxID=1619039 RepID=A0A0G1CDU4_9BACT|nr:MAG: Cell division protein FtsZ [Candidatus Magasanikbacteria bacterium GW2011_GWC2_40_17]KKS56871.1 MAG: Cell division protein FtsZ [Candidatus Magasanikbacteria bacterium GW2011_GWA2_42_32]OGH85655.1 MAG: cell division protein FtsZ [Candidatus Magasanikbacteria bacterium RIFOXYB2_FULL_38_10]